MYQNQQTEHVIEFLIYFYTNCYQTLIYINYYIILYIYFIVVYYWSVVTNQYFDRSFITIQYNIIIPFLKGPCSTPINELKMILIFLSVCFFAGSDIASATKVQSCGEDLAWRGAGEQHGPWCVEQSGRSAASAGERRRRDRMLPYCPGAGGQLSHLTFHHHSPRPLRHSERSPPT